MNTDQKQSSYPVGKTTPPARSALGFAWRQTPRITEAAGSISFVRVAIRPWRPRNQAGRATLLDMRATIELPEPVFQILRARAEQRSLSMQAVILEAIEKEIAHGPTPANVQGRVSLPLIRSGHPGSLHSLTNAEIDDILG